ncbi:MAG: hypothetical protein IK078_04320 [Lachnospiraceae bacterium]|nr:hypothetical protein [Lachnospiraceae bacterium]
MPKNQPGVQGQGENPQPIPPAPPIGNREPYKRNPILTEKDLKAIGFSEQELENAKNMSEKEKETLFVQKAETNRNMMLDAPRLPLWIKATGNVGAINQFFQVYGEQLSTREKAFLLRHRNLTEKINQKNEEKQKQIMEADAPQPYQTKVEVADNGETAFLPEIRQEVFQSSANGCWSVSMMLQLQARGVQYTQEEIRDFRPNHAKGEDAKVAYSSSADDPKKKSAAAKADQSYHSDVGNNFMEMGDAVISMAPDSMIHETEYLGYDSQTRQLGISRTQYLESVTADLRKTILHAIKEDHSPVSFLSGGHYITITGIDKDNKVTCKDSYPSGNREPNKDFKVPLKDLVSRLINTGIQVTWMSEINLAKDGKTIYGIPSKYVEMDPEGKIIGQPGDELTNISKGETVPQNGVGQRIYRLGADEDKADETLQNGVIKKEKVYLPNKINVETLTKKANARSEEAENHLKEVSQSFYNVDTEHRPSRESYHDKYVQRIHEQNAKEQALQKAAEERMLANIANAKTVAATAPQKAATAREKKFDDYISKMLSNGSKQSGRFLKIQCLATAIAADQSKEAGKKFPDGGFGKAAEKCINQLGLMKLTDAQINAAMENGIALKAARHSIMKDQYIVPKERCNNFINDMKMLSGVIKSKEKRSPEYQRFFDAVRDAGKINPNAENVEELVRDANQKLMKSIADYTKGKEAVRFQTGGQQRFNNAMDALSLVYMYTPGMTSRIQGMINDVNKARKVDKMKDPNFVEVTKYGLERATSDYNKRTKDMNKNAATNKTQQKQAAAGKS